MWQALQIMLAATGITVVTGFLISLLIQILTRIVRPRAAEPEYDEAQIAVAIAVAIRRKSAS